MTRRRWEFFETSTGDVEPYLVNPPLIIANPKRKRARKGRSKPMARIINMGRNSKGQFVKRSSGAKKRSRARKNYIGAGSLVPLANPKKHHHRKKTHRVFMERRRRNPPDLLPGIGVSSLPDIATVAGVTGGVLGPPLLQGFITAQMPSTAASNPTLVKGASYFLPPIFGYLLDGRRGARNVFVGEAAIFIASYVGPMIKTALGLSGYTAPVPRGQFGLGRHSHHHVAAGGRPVARLAGYTGGVNRTQLMAYPSRSSRFGTRFGR